MSVGIAQLTNDFIFGGTIRREAFDTIGDSYGENFLSYFDAATPENELKWEYVMKCPQKCSPDFSKANFLVNWLSQNGVLIRGGSLFSNEKEDRIPEWTRSLGTAAFKQAMQERIDTAMSRFKGKIAQWDLINEIRHGETGTFIPSGILETKSGDTNIFNWITDEARKKDSVAAFVIGDNAIITSGDQTAADQFIAKVKPLGSKFGIIGAAGHFGATLTKSSYEAKINYLAQQLGKPVLLTDVDFSVDVNQAPDKIEELMRTCFANPNVKGVSMGSWCQRYGAKSGLTSCFVDSLNRETPTGQRWRDVRNEWKTSDGGFADEKGTIKFTGYTGLYRVLLTQVLDSFYLEPGTGTDTVEVVYQHGGTTSVNRAMVSLKTTAINIKGVSVRVNLPARYNGQLFLALYSLSGQRLSRTPINPAGGAHQVPSTASCSRVFRIETADRLPLFTGKMTAVR
jgi:GH35 family endo-1,4-beta-xylanase